MRLKCNKNMRLEPSLAFNIKSASLKNFAQHDKFNFDIDLITIELLFKVFQK